MVHERAPLNAARKSGAIARKDAYLDGESAVPTVLPKGRVWRGIFMDTQNNEFVFAGSLEQLKAVGRLVLHGHHRPILVIYDRGRVFALDSRCPHMGFPLE